MRAKVVDASVKLPGVELRGLVLPCDALTLDDVAQPKLSLEDAGESRFVAKGTTLHFRSAAGGKGAAVEVAVDDPSALELKRIEVEGAWMRVTTRWADGTTLHGWVKRDELTEAGMHHERITDMVPLSAGAGPPCESAARRRQRAHRRGGGGERHASVRRALSRAVGEGRRRVEAAAARARQRRLGRDCDGARRRLLARRRVDSAQRRQAAARADHADAAAAEKRVTVARSLHEQPLRR